MVSVSSRVTSNPSGRAGAYLVIGVAVVLSLVMARVAFASTSYGYYVGFANPGVPHDSEGWNDRTHNLACRDDAVTHNFGYVRVADYNGAGHEGVRHGFRMDQLPGRRHSADLGQRLFLDALLELRHRRDVHLL